MAPVLIIIRRLLPPWVGIIFALCLTIALSGNEAALSFLRQQISHGEVWRLLTCHFTHLGNAHLAENMAGLLLLNIIVGNQANSSRWLLLTLFCALLISLCLYLLEPQIEWYMGFSGVLHGIFAAGLITAIERRAATPIHWLLLALLLVKLGWEQRYGSLPGSSAVAGNDVVVNAHLYGVVAGVLYLTVVEWPLRDRATRAGHSARRGQHDEQL